VGRLDVAPIADTGRDGWVGTKELPGYRAGRIVVRLAHLPGFDAEHLYFDLLLLDRQGRAIDNHSGACHGLGVDPPLDERSRFVRVVAELLRHALADVPSLSGVGQALTFIREQGVATAQLVAAAQLLDSVSSERGVTHSLHDLLALSLGADEARAVLRDVVHGLAGAETSAPDGAGHGDDLIDHVACIVRRVGKARARRFRREATDFALVPHPDMYRI
jgi:hypothetical protein